MKRKRTSEERSSREVRQSTRRNLEEGGKCKIAPDRQSERHGKITMFEFNDCSKIDP